MKHLYLLLFAFLFVGYECQAQKKPATAPVKKTTPVATRKPPATKVPASKPPATQPYTPPPKSEAAKPAPQRNSTTNTSPATTPYKRPTSPTTTTPERSSSSRKRLPFNPFTLGLRGGMGFNTVSISGSAAQNKVLQTGYTGGIAANIPMGSFAIQPEVNFAQRGIKFLYSGDYDSFMMNYIEVPLLLKLHLGGARAKMSPYIGGYGAYWLSSQSINNTDGSITTEKYEFDNDISNGVADNRIDYGAMAGITASVRALGGYLFLDGRYTYGLADMAKFETKPDGYKPTQHRLIGLSLGYTYPF